MILTRYRLKHSTEFNDFYFNNTEDLPFPLFIVNTSVFGKTLHIQSIPLKICPGDCVYCPYGKTIHQSVDRESFYSIKRTISEISELLMLNTQIKCIAISGPGEPTLNADLNCLIDSLKKITSLPIIVYTCGPLLWRISVQKDLHKTDGIFVNIDAADKITYQSINRFHQLIPYDRYIENIINFRNTFTGDLYVRVCLIDGINTKEPHFYRLFSLVKSLCPKTVFVSTCSLSIDDSFIAAIDEQKIRKLVNYFGSSAQLFNLEEAFFCHSRFAADRCNHQQIKYNF